MKKSSPSRGFTQVVRFRLAPEARSFRTRRNSTTGFTLIELIIVIAIIGVLASIVLASLNQARQKARDTQRIRSLRELQKALELYASDHDDKYPCPRDTGGATEFNSITILGKIPGFGYSDNLQMGFINLVGNGYLGGVITDPLYVETGEALVTEPDYYMAYWGNCDGATGPTAVGYYISFCLETNDFLGKEPNPDWMWSKECGNRFSENFD